MIYLKKKKILHKDSLDILGLDVYSIYTPFAPFNVGKEARNRFEGETQKVSQWRTSFYRVSILPRIRGRSHVHSPVWRVSPSEIRDSIKPHPLDRGKKRARDRGRLWIGVNETNWPKKRARKHPKLSPMTRYAKPEFGIQPLSIFLSPPSPLLLLLLLSSSSSSPRDQQSRRVFLRASKVGCTCYRFNYVRTCGPCVLRSSPTLLSIANETWRNVVRSCKSLGEKARR